MKTVSEITPASYKWQRDKKSGQSSNIVGKMMKGAVTDPRNDAKVVNAWLDSHHDDVVDAVSFAPSPLKAIVNLLMRQPEFVDWDHDRIEDAAMYFDAEQQKTTDEEAGMDSGGSEMGLTLEAAISQAVKRGITSALAEGKKPKAKKITRSQLAEGVRKVLRMALKESGMAGGAMPMSGMGAGATMPPTQEEGLSDGDVTKKGSMTGGNVPSPEELQTALHDIGGWSMDLRGADNLALEYALVVAGIGNPNMDSGDGMHAVLTALSNAPPPDQLPDNVDDDDIENPHSLLNKILTSWEVRYGRRGDKIEDHAQSLASSILDVLGWEWV